MSVEAEGRIKTLAMSLLRVPRDLWGWAWPETKFYFLVGLGFGAILALVVQLAYWLR